MTADVDPVRDAAAEDESRLLTRAEASEFLKSFGIRMKPATLARAWSAGSNGPPCRHVRGKPLYPKDVLQDWAQSQTTGLRRHPHDRSFRPRVGG